MEQIDRAVLSAGEILNQAHHQAVFRIGIDDERGYLALAEHLIGLKSPLTADEVVAGTVCIVSLVTVIGLLRPSWRDVCTMSVEDLFVADPWIDHGDAVD